ncbi:hypothetical protein HID58_003588 [Brassica napus]|uniref:Uncharacterized protein n=1 Tax=Brassica napus TaxID=3708 RepID=A0ABQ8EQH4_BRANA|nr:hypothetical protein HID58_003588 [Brassica napus]
MNMVGVMDLHTKCLTIKQINYESTTRHPTTPHQILVAYQMGNCIVVEKKVIKIMKNDGEVVEYRGPMHTKKNVRFANPEVEKKGDGLTDCGDNIKEKSLGVVRVKMVVSKQELEKLIQGGSVHEMVYRSLAKQHLCLCAMMMMLLMRVLEAGDLC